MAIGLCAMAAMTLAPMLLKGLIPGLGGRGRIKGGGRIKGRGRCSYRLRGRGKRKTSKRHEVKRAWVKPHTRHYR